MWGACGPSTKRLCASLQLRFCKRSPQRFTSSNGFGGLNRLCRVVFEATGNGKPKESGVMVGHLFSHSVSVTIHRKNQSIIFSSRTSVDVCMSTISTPVPHTAARYRPSLPPVGWNRLPYVRAADAGAGREHGILRTRKNTIQFDWESYPSDLGLRCNAYRFTSNPHSSGDGSNCIQCMLLSACLLTATITMVRNLLPP